MFEGAGGVDEGYLDSLAGDAEDRGKKMQTLCL